MKKSFTLIELLVVIVILGMLSALYVPNFMEARIKTRDAQRKSDLKQIQKALELYRQDRTPPAYPTALPTPNICWSSGPGCSGSIYMNNFPRDPLPNRRYYFSVNNNTLIYTLCACLENISDLDASTNCTVCGSCQSGKCYLVTQP